MNWTVRHAQASDSETIKDLWKEAEAVHAGLLPELFDPPGNFTCPNPAPSDNDAMLIAADVTGVICGLHHIRLLAPMPGLRQGVVRIGDSGTSVSQRARRQGCGRRLIEAGEQWGRERGATEVLGTVWAGNKPPRAMLLDLGYRLVAETFWRKLK